LLVRVWTPVRVATVESIAIVTAADPLKLVPDKPVPIVRAFVVLAVTVAEPPREMLDPLTVTLLLVSDEFPIFDSVLLEPEIVLLVKVSVVALPTSVSVAAGRVKVPEAVADGCKTVVPEVLPEKLALAKAVIV